MRTPDNARRRPGLIKSSCWLVVLGVIAATFGPTAYNLWRMSRTEHPSLPQITLWTKIIFPPGSKMVGSFSLGLFRDRSVTAVVRLRSRDASQFISELRKTNDSEEYKAGEETMRKSEDDPTWWDLSSAKNLRCFYCRPKQPRSSDTHCNVLVRQDSPRDAFVYIDGILY